MIDGLVAGRLIGAAVERTAKNGSRFATAKVRVAGRAGEAVFAVNIISFSSTAVVALLALGDGDAVALAGEITIKTFTDKTGAVRPSVDVLAHAVVSGYDVRRRRAASSTAQRHAPPDTPAPANATAPGADDFDDEIPF